MSQIAGSVEMRPGSTVPRNQNSSMTSKDYLTFHVLEEGSSSLDGVFPHLQLKIPRMLRVLTIRSSNPTCRKGVMNYGRAYKCNNI